LSDPKRKKSSTDQLGSAIANKVAQNLQSTAETLTARINAAFDQAVVDCSSGFPKETERHVDGAKKTWEVATQSIKR